MKISWKTLYCVFSAFFCSRFSARSCVAIGFLLLGMARGQDSAYTIEIYNAENGLPQNTVRSIEVDKRGFVWLATEFGLVRFDGQNFKVYNSENTPAIKSNRIVFIGRNLSGRLIVVDGSYNRMLINEDNNSIDSLGTYNPKENYIFSGNYIIASDNLIPKDSIQRDQYKKYIAATTFRNPIYLTESGAYCPISDSEGYAIIKGTGVIYLDGKSVKKIADLAETPQLPFYFSKNGSLYLLQNGSFLEFKNGIKKQQTLNVTGDFVHTKFYSNLASLNIISSWKDDSLVLFLEDAVYSLKLKEGAVETKLQFKLPHHEVISFAYLPSCDGYLLGTISEGLLILRRKRFEMIETRESAREANNYYAQLPLKSNAILLHTGLFDINKRTIVKRTDITRYSMVMGKKGEVIYAQSILGRIGSLHIADSNLKDIRVIPPGGDVRGMLEDQTGTIWYGLYNGLYCIPPGDSAHLLFTFEPGVIEVIFPYNDSTLWIGTRKGMLEYNVNTHARTLVKFTENLYLRNIYRSGDGNIWVGTYGQGFYLYKNGRFIKMPLDENQSLATAHCFVEDRNGFFWIPTNKGLFKVLIRELYDFAAGKSDAVYYYYYDKKSGFNTNEFNGGCIPCSITLRSGIVSLPSLNGLVWFNPLTTPSTFAVNDILIDNVTYNKRTIYNTDSIINLPANAKDVSLEVHTPFFGDKNNLEFEYQYAAEDSGWKKITTSRIFLTSLVAGEHALVIRARKGFGAGNFTYRRLAITAPEKWYNKIFYRILFLVTLGLIYIVLFDLRLKYIRRQNKALEKLVSNRTKELNEANNKLSDTVTELQSSQDELRKSNDLKEQLTSILAHDLKSAMRFTSTLASHLHKKISAGQFEDNLTEITSDLSKTTKETYFFIDEFLLWIGSQKSEYKINKGVLDIEVFFQELQSFFEDVVKLNNNKINFSAETNAELITDRQILKIVVRNLIDNSNKYTNNGNIYVSGHVHGDKYIILIKDTGKGIPQKEIDRLLGLRQSETTNTGLGYRIIMDLIKLVQVKITIDSTLGKGTVVSLELPLKG